MSNSDKQLTHRGAKDYRLNDSKNKREIVLAKAWRELNRLHPDFLDRLLGRRASQTDAEVAATVIQALGEKHNFMWLEENLKKCQGLVKI